MIPYERQEKIIRLLANKDLVKIDQLRDSFPGVSLSTLRRDLKTLEKDGRIEYLNGGGIKSAPGTDELPMAEKASLHAEEKQIIAARAANEVLDGESIYIDSGSNSALLLERLLSRHITIYTTNTAVFSVTKELVATVFILGGRYTPEISSISGTLTENNLRDLYFDRAFLGVNGIDDVNGVTTPNISEATKKRLIRANSKKTYLLCDHSKFHRTSTVRAFDLEDVVVISDATDPLISKQVPILLPES
jgi:DeoR family fructose operon transcriptional repressor